MKRGKILGVDYGDFTIGLAIFDLTNDFIYPLKTIFRQKANILRKSIREIVNIIKIEEISEVVIGLPLNADSSEGDRVKKVKNFARMLENGLVNAKMNVNDKNVNNVKPINVDEPYKLKIHFQDERLTTIEAKSILAEHGIKKINWKKTVDQVAAEIILQDFKQMNKL